jgi:hypothetical protein
MSNLVPGKHEELAAGELQSNPDVRERGLQAAKTGDLPAAQALWESAISSCPSDAEALFLLAAAFHAQGEVTRSAESYRKVLELQPRNIEAHYDLGKLLTDAAVEKMSKTGQKFTMQMALQAYGYEEAVLCSFKTCDVMRREFSSSEWKSSAAFDERLQHYRNHLGAALLTAKPANGIDGPPVYRRPSDWLGAMCFAPAAFVTASRSSLADAIEPLMRPNGVVFVLGEYSLLRDLSRGLSRKKKEHTEIGPMMDDATVRRALAKLTNGAILLASAERVSLGSDFPWVESPLYRQLTLIVLAPDSLVLPELLGVLGRTSMSKVEHGERICHFVS